jgi:hypothetical protein
MGSVPRATEIYFKAPQDITFPKASMGPDPERFSVQADDFQESELSVSCDVANVCKYQRNIHTLMKSDWQPNNVNYRSPQ